MDFQKQPRRNVATGPDWQKHVNALRRAGQDRCALDYLWQVGGILEDTLVTKQLKEKFFELQYNTLRALPPRLWTGLPKPDSCSSANGPGVLESEAIAQEKFPIFGLKLHSWLEPVHLSLLGRIKFISRFEFDGLDLSSAIVKSLEDCRSLRELTLSRGAVSNDEFKHILRLPGLESINLFGVNQLRSFGHIVNSEVLRFRSTSIEVEKCDPFKTFPALQDLVCHSQLLSKTAQQQLECRTNLTCLGLHHVDDRILANLNFPTSLQKLSLHLSRDLTKQGLKALSQKLSALKHLSTLELLSDALPTTDLNWLVEANCLPELNFLHLKTGPQVRDFSALVTAKKLQHLQFNPNSTSELAPAEAERLTQLPCLKSLSCTLGPQPADWLANTTLHSLALTVDGYLAPPPISNLPPSLHSLKLSNSGPLPGALPIKTFDNLKALSLLGPWELEASLASDDSFENLRHLSASSENDASDIVQIAEASPRLRELYYNPGSKSQSIFRARYRTSLYSKHFYGNGLRI